MMIWSEGGARGVTVTVPGQPTLLSDLERRFQAGQGFSVATLNLDHVVKLSRNPLFKAAYAAQTHVTADGHPIVWLSRLAGQKVELVPGSELIEPLAALAAKSKVKVAFFGSNAETLTAARSALEERHPGLEVVLCGAPAMGFDPQGPGAEDDIAVIGASGAGLCFVALGAPKQEMFVARAQAVLPRMGFVSIGAGLDFIAGTQRRAPRLVRALAAEWLWRLFSDPRRLAARYAACVWILPKHVRKALQLRRRKGVLP